MKTGLWDDIRFSQKVLIRNPLLSVTAVIMLAVGLSAAVSIFSLLDALLLRPLKVRDPGTFVRLVSHDAAGAPRLFSYPAFQTLERNQKSFSNVFAWVAPSVTADWDDRAERVAGFLVSEKGFAAMGVRPAIGQVLTAGQTNAGGNPAVLTYDYWERRFRRDPSVVGKAVRVNGILYTVIGVAAQDFTGLQPGVPCEIILPLEQMPLINRGPDWLTAPMPWLQLHARLRPGTTMEQARAELAAIWPAVLQATSGAGTIAANTPGIDVVSAARGVSIYQERFSDSLYVLAAIVGLLLLCICVNLAALMMVRASSREAEIAVRLAIGAQRGRVVRQLVIEILLLVIVGACVGLWLGIWSSRTLVSFWATGPARFVLDLQVDYHIVAFLALLCLCCALVAGLVPAVRSAQHAQAAALKQASTKVLAGSSRFSSALIAAQIALSMTMLSSAGLFVRSLQNLNNQPLDFRPKGVVSFSLMPRAGQYMSRDMTAYYRQVKQTAVSVPGVHSVALASTIPMGYWPTSPIHTGTRREEAAGATASWACIMPDFFRTLGTPLVSGRNFIDRDSAAAPKVAIVNDAFAALYYPNEVPVGHRIGIGRNDGADTEIVGVVRDRGFRGFRQSRSTAVYVPCAQRERQGHRYLIVRTAGSPAGVIPAIQNRIRALGVEEAINALTVVEQMESSLIRERTVAAISLVFGILSTALSACGLYALLAYTVRRRTREIGVRMALGADGKRIVIGLLAHAGTVTAIGVCTGIPAAIAAGRYARSLLFGLPPTDLGVLAGSAMLLILVALAASLIPALRAVHIDPMIALRYE